MTGKTYGECESVKKFMFLSKAVLSLQGDLAEKVALNWLTSQCFELREKLKWIEYMSNTSHFFHEFS